MMVQIAKSTEPSLHATQTVGWLGAGKMGGPMAANLLAYGSQVVVSEPDEGSRKRLVALGATAARSLEDLKNIEIVFSTLPNDQVLLDVAGKLAKILPRGAIFVEMSTVSPDCSERVAAWMAEAGIRYVRSPLSGSTELAEAASLTIFASGDRSGWDEVLPFIEQLSVRQFYLGEAEEARYMKLVVNTLVGASSAVLSEALAVGASGGLGRADMMRVICESAVASPLFKYKQQAIVNDDFSPAFTISQMVKDFTLISEAGRRNNVPLMTTGLILELYRSAANTGMQNEDFFALVKWQSNLST